MSDLKRFKDAQDFDYQTALAEMKNGRKESHWIWYIFPQLKELGQSSTARYFGIENLEEAREYLNDPILGARLEEITEALLEQSSNDAGAIFGWPDVMKFRSCMTLFEAAAPEKKVFAQALEKFYHGERDQRTLDILKA